MCVIYIPGNFLPPSVYIVCKYFKLGLKKCTVFVSKTRCMYYIKNKDLYNEFEQIFTTGGGGEREQAMDIA